MKNIDKLKQQFLIVAKYIKKENQSFDLESTERKIEQLTEESFDDLKAIFIIFRPELSGKGEIYTAFTRALNNQFKLILKGETDLDLLAIDFQECVNKIPKE